MERRCGKVTGNLLVLGEYAVLEPGGLGVTLAVDRYLTVTIEPADRFAIESRWGSAVHTWSGEDSGDDLGRIEIGPRVFSQPAHDDTCSRGLRPERKR